MRQVGFLREKLEAVRLGKVPASFSLILFPGIFKTVFENLPRCVHSMYKWNQ